MDVPPPAGWFLSMSILGFARWMTGITGRAGINIAWDGHPVFLVVVQHVCGVVVLMAINTAERGETPTDVTLGALSPFIFVLAAIDGEIHVVVVKGGRLPCGLRMAVIAGGREARRLVVGVVRTIIVRSVAAEAGVRRVRVVPADVALRTVVLDGGVRTVQWVKIM